MMEFCAKEVDGASTETYYDTISLMCQDV